MPIKDLISNRFSCRKFSQKEVEKEKIISCIEAARFSPSACNSQPWKFIVISDKTQKEIFCKQITTGIYKISKFINNAPVIIAVVADKGSFLSKAGSFIRNTRFYLIDIGISCEHLILQATELGLGSCYVGWFNEKIAKKLLKIPKKFEVPLLILLGYPDENSKNNDPIRRRANSDNRKKLEEILYFESFEKN